MESKTAHMPKAMLFYFWTTKDTPVTVGEHRFDRYIKDFLRPDPFHVGLLVPCATERSDGR